LRKKAVARGLSYTSIHIENAIQISSTKCQVEVEPATRFGKIEKIGLLINARLENLLPMKIIDMVEGALTKSGGLYFLRKKALVRGLTHPKMQ
jgi:hypothetical protein